MENNIDEKIKLIDIENLMFLLFIIASIISIDANEKSKDKIINGVPLGEDLRDEYILSSYLILLVFAVFMIRNYYNLLNLEKNDPEYPIAQIRLFGSLLLVIGQIYLIYYWYHTTTFDK